MREILATLDSVAIPLLGGKLVYCATLGEQKTMHK